MKTIFQTMNSNRRRSSAGALGFTLPEILIATTVFILLVAGIVFANLFGLSMFRITATTLDSTDDTRRMAGKIANEIQTCRSAWVGNVTGGVFVEVPDGQLQQGSGLLIYPSENTNNFVIYFRNSADKTLRRTTGAPGSAIILADSVTNAIVFRVRNHMGTVITNNANNRVINMKLEIYDPKRFRQIADHYQFETSVTCRALKL